MVLALTSDCRDHPRIRGEHINTPLLSTKRDGSSPHTRGARYGGGTVATPERIIPAYAGSTGWLREERYVVKDHPRIRGEHVKLSYL